MWVRRGNLIYLLLSIGDVSWSNKNKISLSAKRRPDQILITTRESIDLTMVVGRNGMDGAIHPFHLSSSRVPGQRKFSYWQFNERESADGRFRLLFVGRIEIDPALCCQSVRRPSSQSDHFPRAQQIKRASIQRQGPTGTPRWMGSPTNRQSVGLIMIFRDPLSSHPEHHQQ